MSYYNLIDKLRTRAQIRRTIPYRKSVQEGKSDRIADLLDEAADALNHQQSIIDRLQLEHEPTEMTPKQVKQWGNHQREAQT